MSNLSLFRALTQNINRPSFLAQFSTKQSPLNNEEINPVFMNRNPRNLEKLRIAYKPSGYHCETPGRDFWHKLVLERTGRHVIANIVHYTGPTVISASTNEWAIKKFLYRTTDMSAYANLGRVLGQRCLESGLTELRCDWKPEPGGKLAAFISSLEGEGVTLSEPPRFLPYRDWDQHRPEKPWEVTE